MKICIYGAGAIGGLIGGKLAAAGFDVSAIARGSHLAKIREDGLTVESDGTSITRRIAASDDPVDLGRQDVVILALKAPAIAGIADKLAPLLDDETAIVTAMNGIPWWYFYGLEGPWRDRSLKCLDPEGRLKAAIAPQRLIGCVVYPAAEIVAPGHVRHEYGNRLMLGELDGRNSARIERLSQALGKAGFKAPVRDKIRDDIWLKLWGNLSFNPVSILTQGTLAALANDPGTEKVIATMMGEAQRIGEKLGVSFSVDIPTRIGWGRAVGEHKSSMLQDLELGRPMEIDALLGAVVEMGEWVGVERPMLETVLALAIHRARQAGCYPR